MTSLVIIGLPVLLLAAVLGLAFIGCEFQPGGILGYTGTVTATAGLVGYWRLDDADAPTGGTAHDSADSHDGTYHSTVTLVGGLIINDSDQAVQLDGQTGYVSIPFDPALSSPHFSVEAWVKPDSAGLGRSQAIVSALGNPQTNTGYGIYIGDNNNWQFWYGDGASFADLEGSQVIPDLASHIVATYDGSTATLWVDASVAAQTPVSVTPTTTELRIGGAANYDPPGEFLAGVIDEVAIYNRALTSQDVAQHYGENH